MQWDARQSQSEKSKRNTPGEQNILSQTDPCKHCWLTHVNILFTGFQHCLCWPLQLDTKWNCSFFSLTALDESSLSHKSSPQAQMYAFGVWSSKSWVQFKKILRKRLKDFVQFAWWIPRVIRQTQAAWCVWMCCLPLPCHVTSWNKLKKTCSGWLLPKNQGAFAMGIQNKWKLCLKTDSCSSFAIFSVTPSVRALSCWDNWKGFHISAGSKITDVGCVNKGKHACTSYLMLSSIGIKEYCGKPFSIPVLLLFYSPPSLFPFPCKGMCCVTEMLVHF